MKEINLEKSAMSKIHLIDQLIEKGVPEEVAFEMGPKDKTGGRDLSQKVLDFWIEMLEQRQPTKSEVFSQISKQHKKLAKLYSKL